MVVHPHIYGPEASACILVIAVPEAQARSPCRLPLDWPALQTDGNMTRVPTACSRSWERGGGGGFVVGGDASLGQASCSGVLLGIGLGVSSIDNMVMPVRFWGSTSIRAPLQSACSSSQSDTGWRSDTCNLQWQGHWNHFLCRVTSSL